MARIRYVLGAVVPILALVLGLGASAILYNWGRPSLEGESLQIVCPVDGDPYVWTPIWNQNLKWMCLRDGHTWEESYPADVYQEWITSSLSPEYVRDYATLYLRQVEGKSVPDPLVAAWWGGRERAGPTGDEIYVYHAKGLVVTVEYSSATAENTTYAITVWTEEGTIVWQGQLFQRQFITLNCGCEIGP